MNDRELLEMAAKAAGLDVVGEGAKTAHLFIQDEDGHSIGWNPLSDDGDALRLAVKLNISINRPVEGDSFQHWGTYADDFTQKIQFKERDNGDAMKATRRAIVRAAAAIGKAMP